eukprot:gene15379-biopygen6270
MDVEHPWNVMERTGISEGKPRKTWDWNLGKNLVKPGEKPGNTRFSPAAENKTWDVLSLARPHALHWAVITGDNWTPLPLSSRYLSPVISRYRYPPLPLSPLPLPPVTCFLTVTRYRYRPLPLSSLPLSPMLWPAAWRWLVGLAAR